MADWAGGADAVHSVADADDGIEVVELECTIYCPIAFLTNNRDFLGSCFFSKFTTFIDVLQMKTYIVCRAIEQHTHSLLGTPHGLVLVIDLYALFLPLNLEDQELCSAISYFSAFCHETLFITNTFFTLDQVTCRFTGSLFFLGLKSQCSTSGYISYNDFEKVNYSSCS